MPLELLNTGERAEITEVRHFGGCGCHRHLEMGRCSLCLLNRAGLAGGIN